MLFGVLAGRLPGGAEADPGGAAIRRRLSASARYAVLGLAIVGGAVAWALWSGVRGRGAGADHTDLLVTWVLMMVVLGVSIAALTPRPSRGAVVAALRRHRLEIAGAGAVCLGALALRTWQLGTYPWTFSGDEGEFATAARAVLDGSLLNPFGTGWMSHPTLYMFAEAGSLRLVGDTVAGARTVSALLGSAAVAVTYVATRRLLGREVALVATVLLATFHVHLFVSRIALNNVGDSLFVMLTLVLVDYGIVGRRPGAAFGAGLTMGLAQYFYFGARLLPLVAASIVAFAVVTGGPGVRDRARAVTPHAALAVAGAVVALLPLSAYAVGHWDEVQGRQRQVSIVDSGWLEREREATGESTFEVMVEHTAQAVLMPFHTPPHGVYRGEAPFVGWPFAVPAALGLVVATVGIRQRRYTGVAVAYWFAVAGLALTEGNPPQAHRFGAAVAPLCVLAAVGLVTAGRLVTRAGIDRRVGAGAVAAATVTVAGWSLHYYFRDENQVDLYSDHNTQVAMALATELDDRGTVYFAGPPRMWWSGFRNIEFLEPGLTGVTLETPLTTSDPRPTLDGPTTFVFLPERLDELEVVRDWFPDGRHLEVTDEDGLPLYVAWTVNDPGNS